MARTSAPQEARRPDYTTSERKRRADVVAAWVAEYGLVCPGWARPSHAASDLTADHVVPVASGGAEDGELGVLCRRCNGSKGARTAPPVAPF